MLFYVISLIPHSEEIVCKTFNQKALSYSHQIVSLLVRYFLISKCSNRKNAYIFMSFPELDRRSFHDLPIQDPGPAFQIIAGHKVNNDADPALNMGTREYSVS